MWLAIDTASDRASVAIGGPDGALAQDVIIGARRHAASLIPAIEACLHSAGLGYGGLEGIVLADGPGSFTGLRVGATVARALIRVRRMPFWVAPSLLVAAAGAGASLGETVLTVSNALRGEFFAAAYRFGGGAVETILEPAVLALPQVLERVPSPFRLAGPAAGSFGGEPTWPNAVHLLGLVGVAAGVRLIADPGHWEPAYGRPAEAQAKWEREHGRPLANPARASG